MPSNHTNTQEESTKFNKNFQENLLKLIDQLELKITERTKNRLDISDEYQQDFYLTLELDTSDIAIAYFIFRTNSYNYDGERTDLHDCQSILFSICCAINSQSVSLWDIENPFSEIEEELYGRYAIISQPNFSVIPQDAPGLKILKEVLHTYKTFQEFTIYYKHYSTKSKHYSWDTKNINLLREKIASYLGISPDKIIGNERTYPDWNYFQIYSEKLSAIHSTIASKTLTHHIIAISKKNDQITDSNITYLKNDHLKHCHSEEEIKKTTSLAESLGGCAAKILPTESHLFAISGDWIVAKRGDFGLQRFKNERITFSKKITEKINFLFEVRKLTWNKKGSPERFEDLCRDILAREPLVTRTRKVSPTNQPDKGRDLIVEIIDSKPTDELVSQSDHPLAIKKYLVQCKYSNRTLGIPKGMGPFESIYLGNYDGYFLITNNTLSSDFTSLLEKIRADERYSADWWTQAEIEEKLKDNIDLIVKYDDLVSYHDQIPS